MRTRLLSKGCDNLTYQTSRIEDSRPVHPFKLTCEERKLCTVGSYLIW